MFDDLGSSHDRETHSVNEALGRDSEQPSRVHLPFLYRPCRRVLPSSRKNVSARTTLRTYLPGSRAGQRRRVFVFITNVGYVGRTIDLLLLLFSARPLGVQRRAMLTECRQSHSKRGEHPFLRVPGLSTRATDSSAGASCRPPRCSSFPSRPWTGVVPPSGR